MAFSSFQLCLPQVRSSLEVLKTRVLQIVFDMLMVHEESFLGRGGIEVRSRLDGVVKFIQCMCMAWANASPSFCCTCPMGKLRERFGRCCASDRKNTYCQDDFRRADPQEFGAAYLS
ncbi:hypothetical protein HD554DRAFT_2087429 [Boletus coccyginus]|nr:hypothetical protein HD554DRAFT_2087429 [Boletus coccyginus]